MSLEIKGTIIAILPLETGISKGTGKEWKKQTAVLETYGQYPKKVAFDMFGDKIKDLKIGDNVNVWFDIDSREFNGKWYTNIGAWRVDMSTSTAPAEPAPTPDDRPEADGNPDLPF